MNSTHKAAHLSRLHIKGSPVVVFNAWDAGSAMALEQGGAAIIGTNIRLLAHAQGYADAHQMPEGLYYEITGRIAGSVGIPVSADLDSRCSDDDAYLACKVERLLAQGIVGITVGDRTGDGTGLCDIDLQVRRIAVIRQTADEASIPLFINARTDLFVQHRGGAKSAICEAFDRASAYAFAGASGFFVPGLQDKPLIAQLCAGVDLPVDVLAMKRTPSHAELADIGVARIDYGTVLYIEAMRSLVRTFSTLRDGTRANPL
ncbi:isocitrate lyase/PEP mutase family protein [Mycobacterium paraterrae]|uniref:Isocitrate lyase/phosphoenolpyruvate mutase family protein n=1 Tax=Mycobacterium paraterrae TaxID=577492 RepID=A0ABY3VK13_9MYCO|nr:isocitrate lyase/phosphoenolpyruvate mutase family protein [Mycobacterium paraterrae]UMB69731.1 isocitrate lyase/phosphoenolpyruvate mutase family protein [Mycobacterium paraterrae]